MQGNIEGLFALGCFTKPDYSNVCHFDLALMATKNFLKKYHKNINRLNV